MSAPTLDIEAATPDASAIIVDAVRALDDERHDEAIIACEAALKGNFACAEAFYVLGMVSLDLESPANAARLLERAHDLAPDVREFAEALAGLYASIGRVADGLFYAKLATTLSPHGRFEGLLPERFGTFFRNLERGRPDLYRARATQHLALGADDEAIAACEAQLDLTPGDAETLRMMARACRRVGKTERAIAAMHAVLHGDGASVDDLSELAHCLSKSGRHEESAACHASAMAHAPDDAQTASRRLAGMLQDPSCDSRALAAANADWQDRFAAAIVPREPAANKDRDPDRPLNVGYVCGNLFGRDIVASLEPVLQGHRYGSVRSFCYVEGRRIGIETERLMRVAHRWTDLAGVDDETAWQILRGDNIDIVVDLVGHGDGGRPMMLARRPAPIALGGIGCAFAGSAGGIDHILADDTAWPAGSAAGWRLACTPFAFHPPSIVPAIEPTQNGVSFGAQLDLSQIGPRLAAMWSRILREAPHARLLLCNVRGLDQPCIDRTLDYFSHMGVRDRVDIVNPADNFRTEFEFYQHIDIALDTAPLNGTRETYRALWMGVPVITLAGEWPGARAGASLLTAAGRQDWIADTPDGYVERAVKLAADEDGLAAIRDRLRQEVSRSPLVDGPGLTRALEDAYRALWRKWCATVDGAHG